MAYTPRLESETFATIRKIRALAQESGLPMNVLAIHWALAVPAVVSVLVGVRTPDEVASNLLALETSVAPDVLWDLGRITDAMKEQVGQDLEASGYSAVQKTPKGCTSYRARGGLAIQRPPPLWISRVAIRKELPVPMRVIMDVKKEGADRKHLPQIFARPNTVRGGFTKYWMVAPAVIFIVIGIAYPTGYLISNTFHKWSLTRVDLGRVFIGLSNYSKFFSDELFLLSLWKTVFFTVGVTLLQTLTGLLLALFLTRNVRGEGIIRALILIPWLTAPVVTGFNFRFMLAPNIGVFPQIFDFLGLEELGRTSVLGNGTSAMAALIFVHTYIGAPATMLICAAGLKSIPEEPYEAALVDGANRWQKLRHITLPLLRPSILVAAFLTTIFNIKAFDLIYIMTGGGPGTATEVLAMYQYRVGLKHFDIGYGSTIAVGLLVIALAISALYAKAMFREPAK